MRNSLVGWLMVLGAVSCGESGASNAGEEAAADGGSGGSSAVTEQGGAGEISETSEGEGGAEVAEEESTTGAGETTTGETENEQEPTGEEAAPEPDAVDVAEQPERGDCGISVDSYAVSEEIPTVGVVNWSAAASIDEATIEFGPAGGELEMVAPVDLSEQDYKTFLIGMKGDSDYDFRVVATSGGQQCVSEVLSLSTGSVPNAVPFVTRDIRNAGQVSPGFVVTLAYGQASYAYIFDKDGDVVWWAPAPNAASAARLSWDSKYVWMVTGNPNSSGMGGEVRRVSVDGTDTQSIAGTGTSHHDLAPLPDGNVAILLHGSSCSEVAEVAPDLSVTTTIDLSVAYGAGTGCHANSILYHPADDTYTISDRTHNLYVKVDRADGNLHWQFGGTDPLGPHIEGSWNVNHGHHVLDNGNILFFNNNGIGGGGAPVGPGPGGPGLGGGASPVHEYALDEDTLTASQVFSYTSASGESSSSLGDVQRLPNGNTLITYSNQGTMHEVNPNGDIVQVITTAEPFGYAMHRQSLYGAPPK